MPQIKFIHLRNFDENEQIMNTGGGTIGFYIEGNNLVYSFAFCSEYDNFSRKIGRAITTGRLHAGDCYKTVFDETYYKEIIDNIQEKFNKKYAILCDEEASKQSQEKEYSNDYSQS